MAAFVPSVARSAARSALRSGARRTAALSNCGATRAFSGTWDDVPSAPQDAIFGLTLAFNAVRPSAAWAGWLFCAGRW